jgi:hypothetical protein
MLPRLRLFDRQLGTVSRYPCPAHSKEAKIDNFSIVSTDGDGGLLGFGARLQVVIDLPAVNSALISA